MNIDWDKMIRDAYHVENGRLNIPCPFCGYIMCKTLRDFERGVTCNKCNKIFYSGIGPQK